MPTTELPEIPYGVVDEATMLGAFLDYYRVVVRRKCEGLNAEQLRYRHAPTTMSLGGLLKHCVVVEQWWWDAVWLGDEATYQWFGTQFADDDDDWEWKSAAEDSPAELLAAYDAAVARAREVAAEGVARPEGLTGLAVREREGKKSSLRFILIHLIEEYARHAGHADLIREAIDGTTGD